MYANKDDELRQIQTKLLITSLIDLPGAILMGLGLYAVFGADGNAFLDILNNQSIAFGAIAAGSIIMAWALVKMISLLRKRAEILGAGNA